MFPSVKCKQRCEALVTAGDCYWIVLHSYTMTAEIVFFMLNNMEIKYEQLNTLHDRCFW